MAKPAGRSTKRDMDINVNIQGRGLYQAKNGGNEWKKLSEATGKKQVLLEKQILDLSEIILGKYTLNLNVKHKRTMLMVMFQVILFLN